jgi:hypothetical protein
MQKGEDMAAIKPTTIVVSSVEAGQGGEGVVIVRFTHPYSDTDFSMRVPVKNLNETLPNILKEAATNVKIFADALAMAASQPLQFSKT